MRKNILEKTICLKAIIKRQMEGLDMNLHEKCVIEKRKFVKVIFLFILVLNLIMMLTAILLISLFQK